MLCIWSFIPVWLSESHFPLCDENKFYESIIPEVKPRNSVEKTQNRQNDPVLLLACVANKRKNRLPVLLLHNLTFQDYICGCVSLIMSKILYYSLLDYGIINYVLNDTI